MSDIFNDLEYYSSIHNCYTYGDLIGIQEEDSYIMKNKKDGKEEICDSDYIRKILNISTESQENGICEFIRGEDEFLEVKIKEKKGLFYIIESTDEEGNTSTRIARQKDLRNIKCVPFNDLIKDKYENSYVDVPSELDSWINSEKYNEVIEQIKEHSSEDSENSELFIISYQDNESSQLRIFSHPEKSQFAKMFFEAAIKKEKELTNVNKDKEKSKKELEEAKKKNKTFYIPQKFAGLIIGKKGINLNNLQKTYGVKIEIEQKIVKENSQVKVIITGDNGNNVEECSKEIDVVQKIFEVSENCSIEIRKKTNSLKEKYRIKMIIVSNEEKKDDEDHAYKAPNVECIGYEEYIDEFYNNEIKDFDNYNYENNYNNNYSSGSNYRYNNKRYNNYYGYQNNSYQPYKKYNSYNYYPK